MLIQKELESKVMSVLAARFVSMSVVAPEISGAWATAQAGLVKWVEKNVSSPAMLNVSVSSPSWKAFSTPEVSMAVRLSLFIRPELDKDGARLAAIAEVIETALAEWMRSSYLATFTALDFNGFSADFIGLDGGVAPTVESGLCSASWQFTVTGSYRQQSNNQNQE